MNEPQLILTIPTGTVTATSLGVSGLAQRRSPGSGKHFSGRAIMIELETDGSRPSFIYLEEGGWRDACGDTISALAGVKAGSRTKTALSSGAFNAVPLSAYISCNLVKTGGASLLLQPAETLHTYHNHECHERMTADQVAEAIGLQKPAARVQRLYMVISPIQFIMLSNLTPEEYAWYATHRPGKLFRQVLFAEIRPEQPHIAAQSRFDDALKELKEKKTKKTKTIVVEECLNRIPFQDWIGYKSPADGGLYVGDRQSLKRYAFPEVIPHAWDRIEG